MEAKTTNGVAEKTNGVSEITNGVAKTTNGVSETTNGVAEKTNGVSETTNGVAKTTNGVSEKTNGVAEKTNGVAETTNAVAEITNAVAAEADEKEEIEEPVHKRQKLEHCCNNHNNHNGNHNGSLSSLTATTTAAVAVLKIKKNSATAVVPSRASAFAAGYDLSSDCKCVVPARGKALVQTGISVAIPEGTYGRIAPRSGLAWKHSIDVGAGVVDCDYRGPLGVVLFNHSDQDFHIKIGDRIAQLIIQSILTPEAIQLDDLDSTVRGNGGFGSTGI